MDIRLNRYDQVNLLIASVVMTIVRFTELVKRQGLRFSPDMIIDDFRAFLWIQHRSIDLYIIDRDGVHLVELQPCHTTLPLLPLFFAPTQFIQGAMNTYKEHR